MVAVRAAGERPAALAARLAHVCVPHACPSQHQVGCTHELRPRTAPRASKPSLPCWGRRYSYLPSSCLLWVALPKASLRHRAAWLAARGSWLSNSWVTQACHLPSSLPQSCRPAADLAQVINTCFIRLASRKSSLVCLPAVVAALPHHHIGPPTCRCPSLPQLRHQHADSDAAGGTAAHCAGRELCVLIAGKWSSSCRGIDIVACLV